MNDIRRSILWVVFGLSMVLIWDKWQIHNGQKPTFFPASAVTAPAPVAGQAPAADASLPSAVGMAAVGGESACGCAMPPLCVTRSPPTCSSWCSTAKAARSLTPSCCKHAEATGSSKDQEDKPFTLLTQNVNSTYVAQSGLIGGTFPTHKTPDDAGARCHVAGRGPERVAGAL
jgi:YidC/Oxa1 family membrane protein insertase